MGRLVAEGLLGAREADISPPPFFLFEANGDAVRLVRSTRWLTAACPPARLIESFAIARAVRGATKGMPY